MDNFCNMCNFCNDNDMHIRLIKKPTNVGNNKNRNRELKVTHYLVRQEKKHRFIYRKIEKNVEP